MRNINWKNFVYFIVSISALIWLVLALVSEIDLSQAQYFLFLIPKVVSIDVILFTIFIKWGWKYKIFRGWLVPYPNLNGSWIGYIYSDWVNPDTKEKIPPIPTMMTIKQSFFYVSCVMYTGEMKSYSYTEGFVIDSDRQLKQLSYLYTSRPGLTIAKRSKAHDGAMIFEIIEKPEMKLRGRYWTERKTTGEIEVTFKTQEILEEIPKDFEDHPLGVNR